MSKEKIKELVGDIGALEDIKDYITSDLETLYKQVCNYNLIVGYGYDLKELLTDYNLDMKDYTTNFIRVHKLDISKLLTDKTYYKEKLEDKYYELFNKLFSKISKAL